MRGSQRLTTSSFRRCPHHLGEQLTQRCVDRGGVGHVDHVPGTGHQDQPGVPADVVGEPFRGSGGDRRVVAACEDEYGHVPERADRCPAVVVGEVPEVGRHHRRRGAHPHVLGGAQHRSLRLAGEEPPAQQPSAHPRPERLHDLHQRGDQPHQPGAGMGHGDTDPERRPRAALLCSQRSRPGGQQGDAGDPVAEEVRAEAGEGQHGHAPHRVADHHDAARSAQRVDDLAEVAAQALDGGRPEAGPATGPVAALVVADESYVTPQGSPLAVEHRATGREAVGEDDGHPGVGRAVRLRVQPDAVVGAHPRWDPRHLPAARPARMWRSTTVEVRAAAVPQAVRPLTVAAPRQRRAAGG